MCVSDVYLKGSEVLHDDSRVLGEEVIAVVGQVLHRSSNITIHHGNVFADGSGELANVEVAVEEEGTDVCGCE